MQNSKIAVNFEGNCLKPEKTFFTHRNAVKIFIADELDACLSNLNTDFS